MNDMPVFGPAKANTQTALEDIAIETGVPIEVLFASGERAGAQSPDDFLNAARQSAQALAPRFQAGEDPMAIIGEVFGPEAQRSFGDYATDVRAALYGTPTAQEANIAEIEEGGFLGTLKRRGQQFIRGATEPFAALPEAKAIAQAQLDNQDTAAEDLEGFDRGQRLRDGVANTFGAPNPEDKSFWAMVAEGAGNLVGMGGASLAAGVAGTLTAGPVGGAVAGFGTGGALGSAMTSSQLYREALDAGATEDVAQKAANWGFAIGATEIVPIARAFKYLPEGVRGRIGNGVMKRFTDIAQSAGEEAAQEYLATVAQNMVAQQLYDPDRGWTEGATEGALVGAVLGGSVGAIGAGVDEYRNRRAQPGDLPNADAGGGAVPPGAEPAAGMVPPVMGDRSPPEQEEPTPMSDVLAGADPSTPNPMTDATARAPQPAFGNYQPEQPVSVRLVDPETGAIGEPIAATFSGEDPAAGYASFRAEDGTALDVDIAQINSGMVLVSPAATTATVPPNVPTQQPAAPAFNAPIPEGVEPDVFVERVAIRQADGMSEQDAYQITLQETLNAMQQDVGVIADDVAERQRKAQENASRIDEAMFTDGDGQPVVFPTMDIAKQRVGAGFVIEPFAGGFVGVRNQETAGNEANANDSLGGDGGSLPPGGNNPDGGGSDRATIGEGRDNPALPPFEQSTAQGMADAAGATDADTALTEEEAPAPEVDAAIPFVDADWRDASDVAGYTEMRANTPGGAMEYSGTGSEYSAFIYGNGTNGMQMQDFTSVKDAKDWLKGKYEEFFLQPAPDATPETASATPTTQEAATQTTETAPADQNPINKNDDPDQPVTPDQPEIAPADQETDPMRTAVQGAIAAGEVTHTTRKGKVLNGYVIKGMKPAEAKAVDPYTFPKEGGAFIRRARADELLSSGAEGASATPDAKVTRQKAIADINKAVTPENKDGIGTYLSGPITFQLDDLGLGDVEITVTNTSSQFKGRAKEIREKTQRFKYNDIKGDLSAEAVAAIEAFKAYDPDADPAAGAPDDETPSASTAPDPVLSQGLRVLEDYLIKPAGRTATFSGGEVVLGAYRIPQAEYDKVLDRLISEGKLTEDGKPITSGTPATVDYPNRQLNMRKARADAPVNGIGDNSDMSLGNIALANAREGDVLPGVGTVLKVTAKQIQITKPDGNVMRLSDGSEKLTGLARDMGALTASSANLRDEQLGSLMEMIERDPALVYRNGVPMLFDDPAEQANRGQRGGRQRIGQPLAPPVKQDVDQAAEEADPNPTDAQKEAGPTASQTPPSPVDGGSSDPQLDGDSAEAQTLGNQWFDVLPRDRQHMVVAQVVRLLNDSEVLRSVVEAVPVDVMNVLSGQQLSPQDILNNPSMLTRRLSAIPSDVAIPKSVFAFINSLPASVVRAAAGFGAEKTGLTGKPGGVQLSSEDGSTKVTGSSDVWQGEISGQQVSVNTNPSDPQKEAGNYLKGSVNWNGLKLSIENPKGSERSGTDQDGETWSVTMPAHYGYFKMTEGADGEHVDFYMGEAPDADYVMWIDQADANTGKFDEHKIMVGFPSRGAALEAYRGAFNDGRGDDRIGGIFEGTVAQLKAWLESTSDSNFDSTKPVNGKLDFPFKKPADAKKPAAKPDAPKRLSVKKQQENRMAKLREYFTPGNIVQSYGGTDRVISFDEEDNGDWTVTVEAVTKKGDEWVKDSADTRVRTHSTNPDARRLAQGPIEKGVPRSDEKSTGTPEGEQDGMSPQPQRGNQVDSQAKSANQAPAKPASILSSLSAEKQARAAELKKRLADKVRNQTSSGLDPEYITLGGELVALYIEAGTKRFGQMLRDFAETTGLSMREAQAPMRAAYNFTRDEMDLDGQDVSDMDSADQVMSEIRKALAEADTPAAPAARKEVKGTPQSQKRRELTTEEVAAIQTDAKTFQYKDNGDQDGVTDRLQGVTEWDEDSAGFAIVYEYADGRMVIADGHQRLGLAKRLQGQGKDTPWMARVYREADGDTPSAVRRHAAFMNIRQGTGTAIDAAKVLRDASGDDRVMNLPPKSALVRDARALAKLSDEAFGMVINEVAPVSYGAAVGDKVADPSQHQNILGLLAKVKPSNARQAEMIAEQAAAETVTETQTSLFGDEDVAQNLYLERAKILDGALSRIKKDRATFKVLRERASVISQEGNVLNQEANERRLEDDAKIQAYLSAEANRKGPISDALTDAARKLKTEPRSIVRITGDFLAAVQSIPAAEERVALGGAGVSQGPLGGSATGGIRQETRNAEGRGPDGEDRQDTGRDNQTLSLFGGDPAPVAPAYPTTLEQVVQKPMAGQSRLSHIYAEYRGGRYYLASVPGNPDSAADEWKKTFPKASVYTTDRADSTSIDGDTEMLEAAIAAQQAAEAPAGETFEPGADGLPQGVMPGMQGDEAQEAAGMSQRQKLELEARQKQSKMRRLGGNDGDAGPLFGNGTDDMFGSSDGGLFDAPQPTPTAPPNRNDQIEAALSKIETAGRGPEIAEEFRRALAADRRALEEWKQEKAKSGGDGSIYNDDIERSERRVSDVEDRILEEAEAIKEPKGEAKPASKSQTKSPDKIEDFGEKIGGARKDLWGGFKDKMDAAGAVDAKAVPLSKSWPEPDYQKLITAEVDPWTVGFIRAARDSIPRKPSKAWKLKGWVQNVEALRGLAIDLMNGKVSAEAVKAKIEQSDVLSRSVGNAIDLYMAVGHEKSLKDLKFNEVSYSVKDGVRHDPALRLWEVSKAHKASVFGNMPRVLVSASTKADAISQFKDIHKLMDGSGNKKGSRDKGTKFQIYSYQSGKDKAYRIGVRIGSNYVDLRKGITEVAEAHRIVREEREQLQAQLDMMRDIPNERRDENAPRMGTDHRGGADITPEGFSEAFGFRGIEFGNWVDQGRRQQDLNDAYDALMDMAAILDIPPKAISLNGSLGLAFGARGKGGKNPAAAHFEPGKMVINLTKRAGRGSLAHEWFHAMDNYFALKRKQSRGQYITDNNSPGGPLTDGVRPETVDAFLAVKRAIASTELKKRSSEMDKMRSSPYWGTGIEMHARAFESYMLAKLADQNGANDYLVNVVDQAAWDMQAKMQGLGESYPYLKPDEVEAVRPAFEKLFAVMERRGTDAGVALEMRGDDFAPNVLSDLAGYDDLFRYPTTTATTVEGAFDQIDPTIEYVGDASRADETAETGADQRILLRTANGGDFYVFQTDDDVWINVADLEPGDGGSAIYAAISDYAFNTGRVFIGDPAGLSDIALLRRTENMLSTALKHGTTAHIMPHQRQLEGSKDLGVPPLKWTTGNDVANVQAMIEVSVANLEKDLPEIANARFNFSDGTFRDAQGGLVPNGSISAWGNRLKRSGRAGGGDNTVKRGIVLSSLLRAERGKRPAILEQVLRQSRQVGEALAGTFYMRGDGAEVAGQPRLNPIPDPALDEDAIRAITKRLASEVAKVLPGKRVSVSLVRKLHSLKDGKPIMGRANADGSVEVSAIASKDEAGAVGILNHELVHVLRNPSLWRSDYGLFERGEWGRLVRKAESDAGIVASVNKRYEDKGLTREQLQEEYVAEMYRLWKNAVDGYGAVERILLKIEDFFRALASAFRGEGFDSAGRIMQRIADGRVGGREGSGYKHTGANSLNAPLRGTMSTPRAVDRIRAPRQIFNSENSPNTPAEMRGFFDAIKPKRIAQTFREAREAVKSFQGKDLVNGQTGLVARVSRTTLDKMLSRSAVSKSTSAELHSLAVANIDDLFARAVKGWDKKDARDEPSIIAIHRFFAEIQRPDGQMAMVKLTVKETAREGQPNPVYTIDAIDGMDASSATKWLMSAFQSETGPKISRPAEDVVTMAERVDAVNNRADGGMEMRAGDNLDPAANPSVMASISKMWGNKPATTEAALDKKEASFVSNLITNAMGASDKYNSLGLVPGEVLFRDLAKKLPSAGKWVKTMRQMTSERQEMHAESDVLAQEWQRTYSKDKENGRKLHDLMHESTIEQIDPSKGFVRPNKPKDMSEGKYLNMVEERRQKHLELKGKFRALPKEMQQLYVKARDAYTAFDEKLINAMVDSVAKAIDLQASRLKARYEQELQQLVDDGIEGDELAAGKKKARQKLNQDVRLLDFSRNARIRKMRLTYESQRLQGPYFPLMRFGQFFVAARNAKGKLVHFERTSTAGAQKRIAAEMRDAGLTVESGVVKPEDNMSRYVDPNFLADIQEALGEAGADAQVLDAIYQRYLETLPSFSIRKSGIHRKGVPGFDKDAIKAFGNRMFHGAHQLVRLRHSMDLTRHIETARNEAKKDDDPTRAGAIVNEMQKRHDWSMNPQGATWSAWATSASFVWYLGLTPGAAVVNLTQTTVVGIPILAAGIKGGSVAKAAKALSGAMMDFTAGLKKGDAEWSRGALTSGRLSDDERTALQAAYNSGALDKSQAHDIAAIGDSGVEYSSVREKAMRPIAFLFHHAERLNREITFLAAYRMSKEAGMSIDEATAKAGDLTWDTHFNYENWSRPRFMQGDVARVAFVFRQFQVNMLYRLFRDSHQALKGESPEVRKQARAQLIGITGSMLAHAGITGTWGYALTMLLAGMFFDGGSDEAEEELKNAIVSTFGPGAGGLLLKGVPGHLTGVDLTSRIGMPELWFRSPYRQVEGRDAYYHFVDQTLGAFPAIGLSILRGAQKVGEGEVWKGVELMVPKAIRDQMRFMRYLNEGVTTSRGDPLIDDVSAHDAIVQAIGFSPARISERYEQNRRLMNEQTRVQDERRKILADITRYMREGEEISARALRRRDEFNAKYPTYAIDRDTIMRSYRARLRMGEQMDGGVRLNPKLERTLRDDMAPSIYN